jgi:hypothetical protein
MENTSEERQNKREKQEKNVEEELDRQLREIFKATN